MKHIEQEVISLPKMDVVKASYKDSVYYIAGAYDITDYVKQSQREINTSDIDARAVQLGLERYLSEHPELNVLKVNKYDVLILDNPETTHDYVIHILNDIFHADITKSYELADQVHTHGFCNVGTFPSYELAHTFSCMVETMNDQIGENLKVDIVPHSQSTTRTAALEVLETLIRRDHPEDL